MKIKSQGRMKNMNKAELVTALAAKTGLTKKDTESFVNGLIETITETLGNGEKISIVGFGNFEVRDRAARKGKNPKTGAEIDIPTKRAPVWKPGKNVKDAVK